VSLVLTSSLSAISPNTNASFLGVSGAAPYVYTVIPGGAGGSINSSTGIYTAPNNTGTDIIVVTDSTLATAQLPILVGTALDLFCDVIQKEMGLAASQVFFWDQKYTLPKDSQLYIAVEILSAKPFGSTNSLDSNGNSLQSVNMMATLSVNIMSRSLEAVSRKEEVLLALQSNYAEAQQEANSFYIAKLSSNFINLSQEDGSAIPYRFNISVNVQYYVTKTKAVPYYSNFSNATVVTEP